MFYFLLVGAGIVAAGIAAVAGFGIGSVLTPILATETGTKLAVAVVLLALGVFMLFAGGKE